MFFYEFSCAIDDIIQCSKLFGYISIDEQAIYFDGILGINPNYAVLRMIY